MGAEAAAGEAGDETQLHPGQQGGSTYIVLDARKIQQAVESVGKMSDSKALPSADMVSSVSFRLTGSYSNW